MSAVSVEEMPEDEGTAGPWPVEPDPRVYVRVTVGILTINPDMQRDTQSKIGVVRVDKIAANFDWLLFETPTCVQRGGVLFVTEGQHRVLALQKRDPSTLVMVCVVPDTIPREQEAQIARDINDGRRAQSAGDKWKLDANAGHLHEILGYEVLRERGLALDTGGPYGILAVAALNSVLKRHKDPMRGAEHMGDVLDILCDAWDPARQETGAARFSNLLIKAVDLIVWHGGEKLDRSRLLVTLGAQKPVQWLSDVDNTGKQSKSGRLAALVLRGYNARLHGPRRIEIPPATGGDS
jgi:hypothetical protein